MVTRILTAVAALSLTSTTVLALTPSRTGAFGAADAARGFTAADLAGGIAAADLGAPSVFETSLVGSTFGDGPYVTGRVIDISPGAARIIGIAPQHPVSGNRRQPKIR